MMLSPEERARDARVARWLIGAWIAAVFFSALAFARAC